MGTRPAIFKWRQTESGLMLCAVGWYLRYSLSLRDVEELLELAIASQAKEKQLLVQLRAYFKQEPLKTITAKRITEYRTFRARQTTTARATTAASLPARTRRRRPDRTRAWCGSRCRRPC